jgi:hypothetical protein
MIILLPFSMILLTRPLNEIRTVDVTCNGTGLVTILKEDTMSLMWLLIDVTTTTNITTTHHHNSVQDKSER